MDRSPRSDHRAVVQINIDKTIRIIRSALPSEPTDMMSLKGI
jgi:hypothetical protein